MNIRHFRELEVYQRAKRVAIEVFDLTKRFPSEERFSLTDQVRRSSRSVCQNIAEAWRRRRYPAAFVAKLNDSESESAETQVCLEFALEHKYIDSGVFSRLDDECEHICAMLVRMSEAPDKWTIRRNA